MIRIDHNNKRVVCILDETGIGLLDNDFYMNGRRKMRGSDEEEKERGCQ